MKRFCVAFLTVIVCGSALSAEAESLTGTGASYSAPLYLKWIAAYTQLHPTFKLDYQTFGAKPFDFKTHSHDLLGTGSPVSDEMLKTLPERVLHIPTFAGPLALVCNLPGITGVKMNGAVLADIYLGRIGNWNDPQLAALNPDLKLPKLPLTAIHRSDGSNATQVLTTYLSVVSAPWKEAFGVSTVVKWRVGKGAKGNDGVAQMVSKTEGSLGYVEFGYALNDKLGLIALVNKSGHAVLPSVAGTEAAAKGVTDFPADLRVTFPESPAADAYPLNSYYFFVLYQDLSYLKDKDRAADLVNFLSWCVTEGQKSAKPFFAALTPELRQAIEAQLKTIVFDGQPILK